MVKHLVFLLWFGLILPVGATESGELAHRAELLFKQGRYQEAYTQWGQALQASRKEANLQAESRIHTALALIAGHAQDYRSAQEHLQQIRPNTLDRAGRLSLLLVQMEMYNAQSQYDSSLTQWQQFQTHEKLSKLSPIPLGKAYSFVAWAQSALGQHEAAQQSFQQATSLLDDQAPGWLAYIQARMVESTQPDQAQEWYHQALEQAISQNQYYTSGVILMKLGQLSLAQGQHSQTLDYWQRAAGVFEQLKLARPHQQVQESLQKLPSPSN